MDAEVVNAGVSGDTSADGLARLDWALAEPSDAAIVEFGANDACAGSRSRRRKANLDAIIVKLKGKGLPVMLAGMKSPRNMGPEFIGAFDAIYPALAKKHGLLFYPFSWTAWPPTRNSTKTTASIPMRPGRESS